MSIEGSGALDRLRNHWSNEDVRENFHRYVCAGSNVLRKGSSIKRIWP